MGEYVAIYLEELEQFRQIRSENAIDLDKFADLIDIALTNLKEAWQYHELVTSFVNGVLNGLTEKHNKLEKENKTLSKENSTIKAENKNLQAKIRKLENAVDNAEQYSRRNCLRISG